jgi:Na+/H+-dicarboxylate symporter/ABC-type amino acid transport substrate-binding protein
MPSNPFTAGLHNLWSRLTSISLSSYILLSLVLGVAVGLFCGEMVRPLNFIGKAFIKLLQMAVLPYIVVSLIHGLGSLSRSDARLIATRGYKLLLFLWTVGLLVIFVFPLAFPLVETSAFFSEADTLDPKKIDFLNIYIPTNIFEALAKGTIPAIVVFSVFLGFALNRIDNKETFLNVFAILAQALSRVTQMIIKTAPLGVFALTAMAAGTLTFDELQRLQVYFVCFIFMSLLLTFSILPAIISCFTPYSYREIMNCSKDALLLGFATGNNFVILPLISSRTIELLQKTSQEDKPPNTIVNSVLPLAYCFPSVGRLLDIFFIVFVAWSVNQPLGLLQHVDLAVAGILSLFGSPKVGVPFLLDYLKLPGSYFELYIISDVVTRKFKVLVQAMSFQTVTLILSFLALNKSTLNLKRISAALLANFLLITCCIIVAAVGLRYVVKGVYHEDIVLLSMEIQDPVPAKVFRAPPGPEPGQPSPGAGAEEALSRVKGRGVLKVGYNPETLPFAFFNQKGELVGYDIFFAHQLARDLGVTLEFIPVTRHTMSLALEKGRCDIVMAAVPITVEALGTVNFTEPYLDMNAAFVVLDYRKKDFRQREAIRKMPRLKIAVTPANTQAERLRLKKDFPQAQVVELAAIGDFFTQEGVADALLTTDKIGKAWALLYPKFGVAVPQPLMFRYDLAYPVAVAPGDYEFLAYLDRWLRLQKTSGAAQEQYAYWVLGKTPLRQTPRWSIIRNVLHWKQ